ncbi:MAG: hypothetical protein A3B31_02320 [Candidatus Komeilibacteria bacterium RIFCSPLOWO2_01_FULL_53_11]|uniref:Uncharacterized protein n=1 Tax=Candidatus Komeilibacteria bacterium RIFCSPLOWO2_01_FULL_53_11 TaxID=1798552 RepID=A0A1G2BQI0_9BACT|nr:MAG: hypothetical protein A3B31_02320 [Candidatus Komeilibacteria bacterium RIFCSPLOWO2_01_FULL_53_11]
MVYVYPYFYAFGYWIIFFSFINTPKLTFGAMLAATVWLLIAALGIGGHRGLMKHWDLWLNYLIFTWTSFAIVLILASSATRNLYSIATGILSALLLYAAIRIVREPHQIVARNFERVSGFVNTLSLWQAAAVIYFMIVSYNAPLSYGIIIIGLLAFILGRGVINAHGLRKSSAGLVLVTLVLTTSEIALYSRLLPVHYYVRATIVASWFYLIIEMVLAGQEISSRRTIFRGYLILLISILVAILLTAAWQ